MNAHIMHIGVVDRCGKIHAVSFQKGLNIITGRSSTGKSALIEIFDYCFGSSDFTVPAGVITDQANLYFTVLRLDQSALVLARRPNDSKAFIKEELDVNRVDKYNSLNISYFENDYFRPLNEFLDELKRHFGVVVTDIDEDPIAKARSGRKSSTPSARSFTSYMLQHQNLVANKHAIFYRFDQKEKREQAIDHLKIFLGFADQTYFIKAQELNQLEMELRVIERSLPRRAEATEAAKRKLSDAVQQYEAITGHLLGLDLEQVFLHPKVALRSLDTIKIIVDPESDVHIRAMKDLEEKRRIIVADLRRKQQELMSVESSIEFSQRYAKSTSQTLVPESAEICASTCPFCQSEVTTVEEQANSLVEAINWLNSELSRSSYRIAAFEEDKRRIQNEISAIKQKLDQISNQIKAIERQNNELVQVGSQYELAIRKRIAVENILQELADLKASHPDTLVHNLQIRIGDLKAYLKENYDIAGKVSHAEAKIRELLREYGNRFEFEESYKPIRLRFSLESFELWHEAHNGQRVFLRAMGSGANWLSCHLVLFLSLHRYFCEVGLKCSIPPVLFLDQPSQVYFPSILDAATKFSPEELAKKDLSRSESRLIDDDIKAVTNMFEQIVQYCKETQDATGIMPQVIVTDHADHLELPGKVTFESLVRKRWRENGDGFINMTDSRAGDA